MTSFSAAIYRRYNLDLQHLTDAELLQHFQAHPEERRLHGSTASTVEHLSMRWLRGRGLEVGAGANPTPLYGNAHVEMADCDEGLAFGGSRIDAKYSIDDPDFARSKLDRFDFAVASHVLEHADSFLRALDHLLLVTKSGGIVYIVVPDINFLMDKNWLPRFEFAHHVEEYESPLIHADLHDQLYTNGSGAGIWHTNEIAELTPEYRAAVAAGLIPQEQRFLHHKHNYSFNDWLDIFERAQKFFPNRFCFVDARYGHERSDCHFVLEVI